MLLKYKNFKKFNILFILIFVLTFFLIRPTLAETSSNSDSDVVPDPVLREELNKLLGVSDLSAPISRSQLENHTFYGITIKNRPISDLSGIEYCRIWGDITLDNCSIENITPIGKLPRGMQKLNLNNNSIKSLAPLEDSIEIKELEAKNNQIDDIKSVFSITNLKVADLSNNPFENIYIDQNEVPVKLLESISLKDCNKLKNFTLKNVLISTGGGLNLILSDSSVENVFIENVALNDLRVDHTSLSSLHLNKVNSVSKILANDNPNLSNISFLNNSSDFEQLTVLWLQNCSITDPSPLNNVPELQRQKSSYGICLSKNKISDVSSLTRIHPNVLKDDRNSIFSDQNIIIEADGDIVSNPLVGFNKNTIIPEDYKSELISIDNPKEIKLKTYPYPIDIPISFSDGMAFSGTLFIKTPGSKPLEKHNITFDPQGAGVEKVIETNEKGKLFYIFPSQFEKGAYPPNPYKDGYYFGGWYTEKDGQGTRITPDTLYSEDMKLYAFWIQNSSEGSDFINSPTFHSNFYRTGYVNTGNVVDLDWEFFTANLFWTIPDEEEEEEEEEEIEEIPFSSTTTINFESNVDSSPAFFEDKMFLSTSSGKGSDAGLYCYLYKEYREDKPVLKWFFPIANGSYSSPTYDNGRVFVGSADGKLYCVNADDGTLNWVSNTLDNTEKFGLTSCPAVHNDTVYITCIDPATLYGFNVSTGEVILYEDLSSSPALFSSPCVYENTVYSAGRNGIVAYSENKELWSFETDSYDISQVGTPVYSGGKIYFETPSHIYSVKTDPSLSNEERLNWKISHESFATAPVVTDDLVLANGPSGLTAYSIKTGEKIWINNKSGFAFSVSPNAPIADGPVAYYTENDPNSVFFVKAVDINTGMTLYRTGKSPSIEGCPIRYSSPVSLDGKLFVGTVAPDNGKEEGWACSLVMFGKPATLSTWFYSDNVPVLKNKKTEIVVDGETIEINDSSVFGAFKKTWGYHLDSIKHGSDENTLKLSKFAEREGNWEIIVNGESLGYECTDDLNLQTGDTIDFVATFEHYKMKFHIDVFSDYSIIYENIPGTCRRLIKGDEKPFRIIALDPFKNPVDESKYKIEIDLPENDIVDLKRIDSDFNWSCRALKKGSVEGFVKLIENDSVILEKPLSFTVFESGVIPYDPKIEVTDQFLTSRGNNARTGVANGSGPWAPGVLWDYTFETKGFPTLVDGTPVVHDGRVYVTTWGSMGGELNGLHCFDALTGERYWSSSQLCSRTGLTIYDGKIYGGTLGGNVVCVREENGSFLWSTEPLAPAAWCGMMTIPLLYEDVAYVIAVRNEESHFYGFDANTGKELFHLPVGPLTASWFSAPSMSPGNSTYPPVVYAPGDGGVFAFDTKTREKIWSFDARSVGGTYVSTPVYADERIYFCRGVGGGGGLFCLNAITGDEIWSIPFKMDCINPMVKDGCVYLGNCAFSCEDGSIIYPEGELVGPSGKSSSTMAGNIIYRGTYATRADNGSFVWRQSLDRILEEQNWINIIEAAPAIQDGHMYVGCENGHFYAFTSPAFTVKYDVGDKGRNMFGDDVNWGCPLHPGDSVTLPKSVIRENSQNLLCAAWYDQPNGTGNYIGRPDDLYVPTDNITLYPEWKNAYVIKYDFNEGKYSNYYGTLPRIDPVFPGENATILPMMPVREQHSFAGWSDGENVYGPGESIVMPNHDVKLKALWKSKSEGSFVLYSFAGGSFLGFHNTMTQERVVPGVKFQILSLDSIPFSKSEDVAFKGWSVGNKTYEPGDVYEMGSENVMFKALWGPSHNVTYDLNGGIYVVNARVPLQPAVAENYYFIIDKTAPSKKESVFLGWSDGNNLYQPGDKYPMKTEDVVLTAMWGDGDVVLSFDANGGEGSVPPIYGLSGKISVLPSGQQLFRKGYTFLGWATVPDASEPLSEYVFPNENTTLYAVWKQNLVSVTYDLAGGIGGEAPTQTPVPEKYVILIKPLPENVYLENYEFEGWLNTNAGRVYKPGDRFQVGTDPVTFVAVWKGSEPTGSPEPTDNPSKTIQIRFTDEEGNLLFLKTVASGSALPEVEWPHKNGYLFKGWMLDGTLVSNDHIFRETSTLTPLWDLLPVISGQSDTASIIDVLILLQYISGVGIYSETPESEMAKIVDFNGDGLVTIIDVLIYLKSI